MGEKREFGENSREFGVKGEFGESKWYLGKLKGIWGTKRGIWGKLKRNLGEKGEFGKSKGDLGKLNGNLESKGIWGNWREFEAKRGIFGVQLLTSLSPPSKPSGKHQKTPKLEKTPNSLQSNPKIPLNISFLGPTCTRGEGGGGATPEPECSGRQECCRSQDFWGFWGVFGVFLGCFWGFSAQILLLAVDGSLHSQQHRR